MSRACRGADLQFHQLPSRKAGHLAKQLVLSNQTLSENRRGPPSQNLHHAVAEHLLTKDKPPEAFGEPNRVKHALGLHRHGNLPLGIGQAG